MYNLFLVNENVTNGSSYLFIDILSLAAILSGVLVIVSKNPIVSVLFLIGLFLSIAGYLMMLGINYIGLSYLLVYVGAVSILFLFILMLINVRISELVTDSNNSIPLAIIIGIVFNTAVFGILPLYRSGFNNSVFNIQSSSSSTFDVSNYIYSLNGDALRVKSYGLSLQDTEKEVSYVSSQI